MIGLLRALFVRSAAIFTLLSLVVFGFASAGNAQTNVLTQHNDVGRTGLNPTETILTPANVNVNSFGKLYSIPIDGQSYAQPLYISSLAINGVNHSALFVATEHDTVTAFDTNAQGAILWHADMTSTAHGAPAGATSDPWANTGCTDVQGPEYGIKSTPVIDPTTNTLYTTSRTLESSQVVWRFHALDVTTGNEKFGGPVVITASVPGTASDAVNGVVNFNPMWQNQRPGLLLLNGVVYVAFGSVCDFQTWHGWVMGYSSASGALKQTTAFIDTPNGSEGGIWMTGAGLAADTENGVSRIFLSTGNGTYDATAPYGTNNMDYSDDVVALTQSSTGGLTVTDEFTPADQYSLYQQDLDVSSGGVVVLPDNLPGSSHPHLLVQLGKAGILLLANRDNLGGYSTNSDNDLQEVSIVSQQGGYGIWGTPAYWNGNVYFWPENSNLKQYSLINGALSTSPVDQGSIVQIGVNGHPFTGTTVSVSSNGTTNPIVWAGDYFTYGGYPIQYLDAYDGTNVDNLLWTSAQFASRDGAGVSQKYAMPTIADGRVYIASQGFIQVYGLLPPDFWMTAAQTLVSIPPTSSVSIPITVNDQGGFTGTVTMTVSGLPTGVTANISNSVLTLSASATAPATPSGATIVVTGTSGTVTHSISILLNVTSLPNATNALVQVPLNLSSVYNVFAIQNDGLSPYGAGLDGAGYAYSAKQLGSSLVYGGIPYSFGPVSLADAVNTTVIPIPAGAGTVGPFNFLATGGGGTNLPFILTYSDGSTTTVTQSMSNWGYPQSFAGETIALSMPYRIMPGGGTQAGPWSLYHYSIPLTSGKTLVSVTLPSSTGMVLMAATLPTVATSQSITFNSIASQSVNASLPLTATASSGLTVFYVSSTTSVCTVSGSTATMVAPGTCTITASQAGNNTFAPATPVSQSFAVGVGMAPVSLSSAFNVYAIFNNGSAPTNGGFDTASYAYSENLLGSSLTTLGVPFTLGSAGVADAVSNATISIPAGAYGSLNFLAAGVFGNFVNQAFVLTFTDGTTTTYTQSVSDWCTPQSYPGETIASSMAYRVSPGGTTQSLTCDLYAYSLLIPSGKTVKSFKLPASRNVVILGITMGPSAAATPTVSPAAGAYAMAQVVTLTDSTPGASIYYTTNGSAPNSASTLYTSPLTVSTTETLAAVAVAAGYSSSAIVSSAYTINGSASAPTFSVPGGSYTAAQTVALSDTAPGAKIYYTTNGTTPTTASTLYSSPIAVSVSETINALATAPNYGNSAVATATYSFGATSVNLSTVFNVYGIFNSGTAPTHGGIDGTNYAYAGSTLPTGITLGGAPVTFGPVAAPDAVANTIVTLPKGQFGSISLLAADSYGPLVNQTFVVTYSDGTTSTFTQSMSDWGLPQKYSGETIVVTDPQRIIPSGALQAGPWYMYGYTFSLNSAKTVSTITLPKTGNVFVFAMTMTPASSLTAQTIAFAPIASQTVGTTLSLAATATSGSAVTFTSTTASVCTVSGSTASLIAAGTCLITATQAGNSTFAAATPVSQSFTVAAALASQTITFNSIATQTVGTPLTLSATASSGLAVSYSSSTSSVCTVSNTTATFLTAGTCTLTASQGGNTSYAAATPVAQNVTVQAATATAGYDVVLLVGQSNMVGLGTGTDDAGDAAADPRIMQWSPALGAITPAFDPLNQNSGPYNIGMGMTFAKAYVKHMAPNRKLLLVGAATGATGFANGGYWLPPSGTTAGGVGATTALSWVNYAMAAAGANAHLVGILWHQGETDIQYSGASAYETNLLNLISYFRTNITGASSTTPFIAGEMVNPWLTYNLTTNATWAAAQIPVLNDFHTLPDTVPYTAWTSAAELTSDPYYSTIHFSALSHRQLGRRYADKFFEAQNNLPQPQASQKWWAGTFYDDGRGLGSANTNTIPVNNPATVTGTVTAAIDPVRGNVAQISQGNGNLSYQVPGTTFNGSYTKMAWFLPGASGYTNNLISANNTGQIHYLFAQNQGNNQFLIAAGHSSAAVANTVSAQVTNPAGAWMNIALVYNATAQTMTLYLNGAVVASQSSVVAAPSSTATTLPLYVGSYGTGGYGMDGEIAGSRVWTAALSAAQVSAIYNYEATGTGNEPGFGIVVGTPSQAAYSPATPGLPYSVPTFSAIAGGAATSLPVTIVPNNGFTGTPSLALTGLPAGASYALSSGQTPTAYTLQINALPASGVAGAYPLVLTGTSSTVSSQAAARLCVSVPDSSGNLHVDLSCYFNHGHNIVTDGTTFTDGGLAGTGYAFSSNLLGTTVTSGSVQFSPGAPNGVNGLSAATVNLPAGQYSSLAVLGTGINGAQTSQIFTVTYTDGTTSTFTQSLSDWATSQSYSGETVASSMSYVDVANGTETNGGGAYTFHLYSYAFALNNAKTVTSITVPNNSNVIVMAMTLKH